MSFLLIRSLTKFPHQNLSSIYRCGVRALSLTPSRLNIKNNDAAITKSTASDHSEVSTSVKPIGERIKENTKTASYMGVIAVGVAVTGIMFFAIFRELLSSESPNNIYSAALEECINDPRVQDSLGMPIKGYGEETRRRRRQHVAHSKYERNGVPYIRMQFYIQGIRNKATVQLEKRLVKISQIVFAIYWRQKVQKIYFYFRITINIDTCSFNSIIIHEQQSLFKTTEQQMNQMRSIQSRELANDYHMLSYHLGFL